MLAFLTLFLGLVSGVRTVDLSVGDSVVAVEVRLDGKPVRRLGSLPWSLNVDFGETLRPHELSAFAIDRDGHIIAKALQKINLPRSLAEATLQVLPGTGGKGRYARLSWQCVLAPEPSKVTLTFDGKPLVFSDFQRIPLPAFVPEQLHFMKADLDFPRNITASAETTFGGQSRDETQAELTAVAILAARRKTAPPDGALEAGGQPLKVVAVEEDGPAEIAVVLDEAARPALAKLAARFDSAPAVDPRFREASNGATLLKRIGPLGSGQRLRFVWPLTENFEHGGNRYEIFPRSEDFDRGQGGFLFLLTHVFAPGVLPAPRLADAVAVAGLSSVARNRARVVVLVLGGSPDASALTTAGARGYLSALGVPLFVWTTGPRAAAAGEAWAGAADLADVSSLSLFDAAADRVTSLLARERIVWVEGVHLPQDIGLSASASGLTLVR
jgi:hypothetical protein